jgi:hypothetical protein
MLAKLLVGVPEHDTGATVVPLILKFKTCGVAIPPAP